MPQYPETALALLEAAGEMGPETFELKRLCPDPMQLFVLHPGLLRVAELAAIYASEPGYVPDLIRSIRTRMSVERWSEQRAIFQAKRFSARQDAIVDAEATVMASFAVDFHILRLKAIMSRWEMLTSYVEDELMKCLRGDRTFTTDLRDSCKELRDIEDRLDELFPKMGIEKSAAEKLTKSTERRDDLIQQVERQLTTLRGADQGATVLRLLRGGSEPESESEESA